MTVFEALGFFYVVFATGLFTAAFLIAAGVAGYVGLQTLKQRYIRGAIEERKDLLDQLELKRMTRTGQ